MLDIHPRRTTRRPSSSPSRRPPAIFRALPALVALLGGCADDVADTSLQAIGDEDAAADVTPDTTGGDVREAGSSDVADGDTAVDLADTRDTSSLADADAGGDVGVPDTPPSTRCGDGIRDPLLEECDDGLAVTDAGLSVTDGGVDASEVGDASPGAAPDRRSCTDDCHVRDVLAVSAPSVEAGPGPLSRTLGHGRHPIAGDTHGFAVAFVEPSSVPPVVGLTTFDSVGKASDRVVSFGVGSTPALDAHPVLAATGDGRFYAAWTDFDGDGDELGIALRMVDPLAPSVTAPGHANTTTSFSQYDADILAGFNPSGQVVVAWVDDSNASTGPDVRARLFDRSLSPLGGEIAIGATPAAEADVALAAFGGAWAIAYKSSAGGLESIVVQAGALRWQTEAYLSGPSTSRPSIAALDGAHMVLVFAADDGADYAIRAAILDVAAPGPVASFLVAASAGASDRREPNVVRVGGDTYIAWRAAAMPGDISGDELWLKPVTWSGSTLDVSQVEVPLPRASEHGLGDQRRPALAGAPLTVGGTLVTAWDDLSKAFGAAERSSDVVVDMIPIPMLRLGGT